MAEQSQTQPLKKLTNSKDLEGLNFMDEIELTYWYKYNNPDMKPLSYKKEGIFGGTFEMNGEKYLMLTLKEPSDIYDNHFALTSSLYKIQDNEIIANLGKAWDIQGYCRKTGKFHNLETALKRHLGIFHEKKINEAVVKAGKTDPRPRTPGK